MARLENTEESRRLMVKDHVEAERMRDVRLLLDHLFNQEEVTIKFIFDCLYDVGSVNFIDQKFRSQPLNRIMQAIAVMSKPAFRIFALRWSKKNGPQLITKWLQTKVRFNTPANQLAVTATKVIEAQSSTVTELEQQQIAAERDPQVAVKSDAIKSDRQVAIKSDRQVALEYDRQIRQLRYQVRWLTGILIGVVLLWGGSVILPHAPEPRSVSLQERLNHQ